MLRGRGAHLSSCIARSTRPLFAQTSLASPSRMDRDRDDDLLVEVDLDEVDVLHVALHRVALDVLDDRRVHRAVDGEVEDGVHARSARQGAGAARGDRPRWRSAPCRGRTRRRGSCPRRADGGSRSSRRGGRFRLENGLRHGDRLPSDLVTAPTDRAPRRYSSVPIYRPSIASPPAHPHAREPFVLHRKMRSIVHWAGSGPHMFGDRSVRRAIDAGDLCRCGVRVVAHRLVESD